jgi:hypothetical protein
LEGDAGYVQDEHCREERNGASMIILMSTTDGAHPTEQDIELYSMGRLPEHAAAHMEEHLLLCGACRERLDEADEFVAAMQGALRELNTSRVAAEKRPSFFSQLFSLPKPVWAGALAAVVLVFAFVPWRHGVSEPHSVQLDAFRGAGTPLAATAPAGRPLVLEVDVQGLPVNDRYRVEIADRQGDSVWQSSLPATGKTLMVPVKRSLTQGRYWIRVYEPRTGGELLREFALSIE